MLLNYQLLVSRKAAKTQSLQCLAWGVFRKTFSARVTSLSFQTELSLAYVVVFAVLCVLAALRETCF
jgi:hypothetical protein